MSVTIRFQSTGTIPGDGAPKAMAGSSLTIGRGEENDLVLPDPDRTLSKRHCVIEDQPGGVVVIDISTNGTFLNYGKSPLGPTPAPLNDGDILSIGPYELVVDIVEESDDLLPEPLGDAPVMAGVAEPGAGLEEGDFIDELLGGREVPKGPGAVDRPEIGEDGVLPPLDDAELTPRAPEKVQGESRAAHTPSASDQMSPPSAVSGVIPDDWDDEFLAPEAPKAAPERPVDTPPEARPNPFSEPGETVPPGQNAAQHFPPDPADVPAQSAESKAAAQAFLDALGQGELTIPDEELTETMARLGAVLRTMIEGTREILMTRSSIRVEFGIDQTRIQREGNNPLKFSVSPEQAIEALSKTRAKGYQSAVEAAEEALRDIKAHEVAMVTGMEAALKSVLARLDPAALEETIQSEGGLSNLLKSKKARYWEIYEKIYADISEQAESDFQEFFSREFARAYKDQLERLK